MTSGFLSPLQQQNHPWMLQSVTDMCLITEVKQQWTTFILEWETALVQYSCIR